MPSTTRSVTRAASELRGLLLGGAVGLLGVIAAVTLGRRSMPRPGPEDAALDAAHRLRTKGDMAGALATLLDCTEQDPTACRCIDESEEIAVDLGRYGDALLAVKGTHSCNGPADQGARAEALVGSGQADVGLGVAATALGRSPGEPHANFAKAWALSAAGFSPQALAAAEAAVKGGRGVPALLLLGTLRSKGGDNGGARDAIEQASRLAPDNPRVAYDIGVVAQAEGHYREAREAYLHALALDPKMADARYNLVVLTHSAKADDEARHHLDELAAAAPGDPRIPGLRAALSKP